MNNKTLLAAVAVALSVGMGGQSAHSASVLGPAVLDPGATASLPQFGAAAALLATKTETFSSTSGPVGTLSELVVNDAQYSPYGTSGIAFVFDLSLTSDNIASFSLPGFAGFQTAVKTCPLAACSGGTGTPPDTATRSVNGDVVSFLFRTPLVGNSGNFTIYTSAKSFVDPSGMITDSFGNSSFVNTFGPSTIPEPATWAVFLVGFGGLGAVMRANRRKHALDAASGRVTASNHSSLS